jgi:ATP synthase protein I
MSEDERPPSERLDRAADDMVRHVGRRRERLERHRREGDRSFWSNLGLMGAVGWSIVIPALLGGFLGRLLDRRFGSGTVWTLSLLLVGLVLGCWSAWAIIHSRRD